MHFMGCTIVFSSFYAIYKFVLKTIIYIKSWYDALIHGTKIGLGH